jgi:hypothetical protein
VLEQGTDEARAVGHGWTYSAHPIGAAAGVANLKLIDELGLVKNAGETGAYLNGGWPRRWPITPSWARCAARACWRGRVRRGPRRPRASSMPPTEGRPRIAAAMLNAA